MIAHERNPLKQAADSIIIDNTKLSIDEQFKLILNYCEQTIQ